MLNVKNELSSLYTIGPATNFFGHGQKRDYLSHALQRARGATKNYSAEHYAEH